MMLRQYSRSAATCRLSRRCGSRSGPQTRRASGCRASGCRSGPQTRRVPGFTLTELTVVVAVIAVFVAILQASVSHARQKSRAVNCQTILRDFGGALALYLVENHDQIPGVNTSGVAIRAKELAAHAYPDILDQSNLPVQSFDWMTPLAQYGLGTGVSFHGTLPNTWGSPNDPLGLPADRAARWNYLWTTFRCPAQHTEVDEFYPPNDPFGWEFAEYRWPACSYLMPAYFSYWGLEHRFRRLALCEKTNRPRWVRVQTLSTAFDVINWDFRSRLDQIGPLASKIFVADGTRYLLDDGTLYFNISVTPAWFGAFSSLGGWDPTSNAYGVAEGTYNWDGDILYDGNVSHGLNLPLTYRHGWGTGGTPGATRDPDARLGAQDNKGNINALFFDGHVTRLDDRASRNIDQWYPTGSVVQGNPVGMTTVPSGYIVH